MFSEDVSNFKQTFSVLVLIKIYPVHQSRHMLDIRRPIKQNLIDKNKSWYTFTIKPIVSKLWGAPPYKRTYFWLGAEPGVLYMSNDYRKQGKKDILEVRKKSLCRIISCFDLMIMFGTNIMFLLHVEVYSASLFSCYCKSFKIFKKMKNSSVHFGDRNIVLFIVTWYI